MKNKTHKRSRIGYKQKKTYKNLIGGGIRSFFLKSVV